MQLTKTLTDGEDGIQETTKFYTICARGDLGRVLSDLIGK